MAPDSMKKWSPSGFLTLGWIHVCKCDTPRALPAALSLYKEKYNSVCEQNKSNLDYPWPLACGSQHIWLLVFHYWVTSISQGFYFSPQLYRWMVTPSLKYKIKICDSNFQAYTTLSCAICSPFYIKVLELAKNSTASSHTWVSSICSQCWERTYCEFQVYSSWL